MKKIKEKKGEAETKEFTDSQTNFAPDAALQNARQEGMPLWCRTFDPIVQKLGLTAYIVNIHAVISTSPIHIPAGASQHTGRERSRMGYNWRAKHPQSGQWQGRRTWS